MAEKHLSEEQKLINFSTQKPMAAPSFPVLCERIRFFREKAGMEQKALAAALGITGNAISNWESGRARPDVKYIPTICSVLHITLYDLFGLEDFKTLFSPREEQLIKDFRRLSQANQGAIEQMVQILAKAQEKEASPDLIRLPFSSLPLAAGLGDPSEFEQSLEPIYLYPSEGARKADWVFLVNGSSMEPDFQDQDMVFVQSPAKAPALRTGTIGAFATENEYYIKEYREDGLYSTNPLFAPKLFCSLGEVYYLGRVIGKVTESDLPSPAEIARYQRLHQDEEKEKEREPQG